MHRTLLTAGKISALLVRTQPKCRVCLSFALTDDDDDGDQRRRHKLRCHTAKVASSLFYFFHFWHLSRKHVNFSSLFFPPARRRFGVPGPQSQTPQLLLFRGFVVVVVFVVVVCFSNTYTHIQPTRDLVRNRCNAATRVKCDAQLAGISRRLLTAATPPRRPKT